MAENESREKKKKGGGGIAAGVLAVLLLSAGGYLGFGGGRGPGGGDGLSLGAADSAPDSAAVETAESSAPQPSETAQADSGAADALVITVRESEILLNGTVADSAGLDAALLELPSGTQVRLEDDHAIKATWDEVVAALQTLDIAYTSE